MPHRMHALVTVRGGAVVAEPVASAEVEDLVGLVALEAEPAPPPPAVLVTCDVDGPDELRAAAEASHDLGRGVREGVLPGCWVAARGWPGGDEGLDDVHAYARAGRPRGWRR